MKRRNLSHPCETLTDVKKSEHYEEHGTPIRELIGASGMRAMGRALDLAGRKNRRRK